jgi:hypothetical protein
MCAAICYNTDRLIEVLGELHRFLDGDKVTLVWDNLSAHTSRTMRAWIRAQRSWLVVEQLPSYAPDLNPVETLWTNLKSQELANLATDSLDEVMARCPPRDPADPRRLVAAVCVRPTLWDLVLVSRNQADQSG